VSPAIAFFDLDRTLISKNSGALWLMKEIRERTLAPLDAVRGLVGLLRYSLGSVELEALVRLAIRRLEGVREDALAARIEEFYRNEVSRLYRPGARAALEQHRSRGDRIVLLTSASSYLSEHVKRELGLDDILCNRFEVGSDGTFSGRPAGTICFGKGKLVHAEAYAASVGLALGDATFYTDSLADLPVLEVIGRPVAIHPDPRLSRIARARGWPIEDWSART
jgi:HAD superfamily hydrolase (TIGR01490 family)